MRQNVDLGRGLRTMGARMVRHGKGSTGQFSAFTGPFAGFAGQRTVWTGPCRAAFSLAIAVLAAAGSARAGGFEVPDNGARALGRGAAFTARADDGTALEHNPGAFLRQRGHRLTLSHNTVHAPMSFTRTKTGLPNDPEDLQGRDPLATVENETPWFFLGGFLAASSDFGLENWRFAAGVYGPSGSGHQEWPIFGGQRYMLTGIDVLLVYYSAAIAYGRADQWGVGATLQLAHQPKTKLSLAVDGTPGGALSPYYSGRDIESTIDLAAPPVPTAVLGAWWRPVPWLELGASGRPTPVELNATGHITLTNMPPLNGKIVASKFIAQQLAITNESAALTLTLPPYARAGVRYRSLEGDVERFDVEVDVVWEGWSVIDKYNVLLTGDIQLFSKAAAPPVVIEKRWKDTLSVRLGGTYDLAPTPVQLSAGAYYETGAVPNDYTHLDFPSFDRVGTGAGVSTKVGSVELAASYLHVFQSDRTVSEQYGRVYQQRPVAPCPGPQCKGDDGTQYDGVPANAGTYTTAFNIIGVSASVGF
ncbi:MAG: hypothetical protein EXR79_05695 [Myxococcales bacterium]|nr:hypothetical protein [Myxococcales bacterium]